VADDTTGASLQATTTGRYRGNALHFDALGRSHCTLQHPLARIVVYYNSGQSDGIRGGSFLIKLTRFAC
jgi:hypothetical protein